MPTTEQQQAKRIAWLESMLDTSIVAYESHRNALENIYAQLAQWQQPPNTGCIHLTPDEVNELLRDINDVLDQCALQLQPFPGDRDNNHKSNNGEEDGPGSPAAAVHPCEQQEPDSRGNNSRRGVTNTPSLPSPSQDHHHHDPQQCEQQEQQRSSPPPASSVAALVKAQATSNKSTNASRTPSERSHRSQRPRSVAAQPKPDSHEMSAGPVSDAPSRRTDKSATNPSQQQQQKQQLHKQEQQPPLQVSPQRTESATTPSQTPSVPPSAPAQGEGNAGDETEDVPTPAVLMSDIHSVHSHHRQHSHDAPEETDNAESARESSVVAPVESSVRSAVLDGAQPQQLQKQQSSGHATPSNIPTRERKPLGPASQSSVPDVSRPAQLGKPEQRPAYTRPSTGSASVMSGSAQESSTRDAPSSHAEGGSRPRMQTCYHHQRVTGLALTPWPILHNGRNDAAAIGGPLPPSAAARAIATKDELPAEQYNTFKERGTPLKTSPERRAAADALERRALAVEKAKQNATYASPEDDVAEKAAAAAAAAATSNRARQPAPTSHHTSHTPSASLNDSQRSHHLLPQQRQQQQQQQQQQQRGAAASARTGPTSVASSSVAGDASGGPQRSHHGVAPSQSHLRGDEGGSTVYNDRHRDYHSSSSSSSSSSAAIIPRRRGSSGDAEAESESSSSVYPSYVIERKRHSQSQPPASQHSQLPPQQSEDPSHQHNPHNQHQHLNKGSRTPSQVGSTARSASANDCGATRNDTVTSTPHQLPPQQQPTVASSSRASSAVGPRSDSAHHQQQPSPAQAAEVPPLPVKRQLNTDVTQPQEQLQMDASQSGSLGLVYTPSTTPQRDSARDLTPGAAPPSSHQQQQQAPGAHRPLRTAVPRRTTPRAYDSSQSEDAIFRGRHHLGSPGRPPVRTDSPDALRYMDREDSRLRQRREEELAAIRNDPRVMQQQPHQQLIAGPSNQLKITDGSAEELAGRSSGGKLMSVAGEGKKAEKVKLTAVEEQLLAERTVLHNQLEKLQMEVTIATARNKEWGNERRYAQLNSRMTRVMEDLDRVEKELRTVRNYDRETRCESASKTR
jgi:hypothetical protein